MTQLKFESNTTTGKIGEVLILFPALLICLILVLPWLIEAAWSEARCWWNRPHRASCIVCHSVAGDGILCPECYISSWSGDVPDPFEDVHYCADPFYVEDDKIEAALDEALKSGT